MPSGASIFVEGSTIPSMITAVKNHAHNTETRNQKRGIIPRLPERLDDRPSTGLGPRNLFCNVLSYIVISCITLWS